jgi:hypothetical protein
MNKPIYAITKSAIEETKTSIPFAALMAFIQVESGGKGFDSATGKLLIQFEPHYFKKREPYAPSGAWSVNRVDVQKKEWEAFSNAFGIDKESAMESTSIGLPQIMGAHWKRLGYDSVGAMWDDFKTGELSQVKALIKFIETDQRLYNALRSLNWPEIARIYNGAGYKEVAKKYGRQPYDQAMADAYRYFV